MCRWVPILYLFLDFRMDSKGKNGLLSREFLRHSMCSVTPRQIFLDKVSYLLIVCFLCVYVYIYIYILTFFIQKKGSKVFSPASHSNLVDETNRRLLALPHRCTDDAGKYSLLRIIASFPAQTNLKRCLEEDPDDQGHPIASLNMSLLKQVTRRLSPIDFLQGLEDPLQNNGKRKRGVGYRTTRYLNKKIKLN